MLIPTSVMAQSDGGQKKKARTEHVSNKNRTKNKTAPKKQSKSTTGTENGHEWIDLGLPSGNLWASENVGANPYESGEKYEWGILYPEMKYESSYSITTQDISGKNSDTATYNWGGRWKMPTRVDFLELTKECQWEYGCKNDIDGFYVTGPNANSIFFPMENRISAIGDNIKDGVYWSSTPVSKEEAIALFLCNNGQDKFYEISEFKKEYGHFIRPIISQK